MRREIRANSHGYWFVKLAQAAGWVMARQYDMPDMRPFVVPAAAWRSLEVIRKEKP